MKELDTTATLPKELDAAAFPKELDTCTAVLQDLVAAALPRPKELDTTATLRKELDASAFPKELVTCTAVLQDPVAALQKELDIATLHPSEEPDERVSQLHFSVGEGVHNLHQGGVLHLPGVCLQ